SPSDSVPTAAPSAGPTGLRPTWLSGTGRPVLPPGSARPGPPLGGADPSADSSAPPSGAAGGPGRPGGPRPPGARRRGGSPARALSLVGTRVWRVRRELAVAVSGVTLLADGVYLAVIAYSPSQSLTPFRYFALVHIITVTLLASFRTGLKLATWHTLLLWMDF